MTELDVILAELSGLRPKTRIALLKRLRQLYCLGCGKHVNECVNGAGAACEKDFAARKAADAKTLAELGNPCPPFMVVLARDSQPIEAWQFNDEAEARSWFDSAGLQWTEIYLCSVLNGPGKPQPSIPLNPLQAKALLLQLRVNELERELETLRAP